MWTLNRNNIAIKISRKKMEENYGSRVTFWRKGTLKQERGFSMEFEEEVLFDEV